MELGPLRLAHIVGEAGQAGTLYPVCANVTRWPFSKDCFSAVVCIHIVVDGLLESARDSLVRNGLLYVETFGNHGRNYLDLPKAGEFRDQLAADFDFLFYRERNAGPPEADAVSVTFLARKNQ